MTLETENRVHASAVCFWEVAALPPAMEAEYTVGFQSRHNFSAVALRDSGDPSTIRVTMVQPIAKAEAIGLVLGDLESEKRFAGVSIGPPSVPVAVPFVDDTPLNAAVISLPPPRRLTIAGGTSVGDRANFYVMILAVPPSPEQLSPLGTL